MTLIIRQENRQKGKLLKNKAGSTPWRPLNKRSKGRFKIFSGAEM